MPPRHIAVCAAFVIAIAYGGTPGSARRPDPKMIQRIAAAVATNQKLEETLAAQLRSTAGYLRRFRLVNGSYPESPVEIESLRYDLGELLPENPYSVPEAPRLEDRGPGEKVFNLLDPPKDRHAEWAARFHVFVDRTLRPDALDYLRAHPPETWQAEPGTITIISNGSDLCAVWGAGSSGRPLHDWENGQMLLVTTDGAGGG